jgi:hypothetical protein
MLQYTAVAAYSTERGLEAAVVLAVAVAATVSHDRPASARRMSHDRIRAGVEPSIAFLVPRINAR